MDHLKLSKCLHSLLIIVNVSTSGFSTIIFCFQTKHATGATLPGVQYKHGVAEFARIVHKANSALGFVRRNMLMLRRTVVLELKNVHTKLVRPILEYSRTVWDPHTSRTAVKIESVQRRAAGYTGYTRNRYHRTSSVSAMADRRRVATLLMFTRFTTIFRH